MGVGKDGGKPRGLYWHNEITGSIEKLNAMTRLKTALDETFMIITDIILFS